MKPGTRAINYWLRQPQGAYHGCPRRLRGQGRDWYIVSGTHDRDFACCWEARWGDWTGAWKRVTASYDDRALWPEWSI